MGGGGEQNCNCSVFPSFPWERWKDTKQEAGRNQRRKYLGEFPLAEVNRNESKLFLYTIINIWARSPRFLEFIIHLWIDYFIPIINLSTHRPAGHHTFHLHTPSDRTESQFFFVLQASPGAQVQQADQQGWRMFLRRPSVFHLLQCTRVS